MALILLGVSALLVVPFVSYGSTVLLGARKQEAQAMDRHAADAGAEHALWRIKYDSDFVSSLSPSADYTQSFNGRTTSITVTAAATPTPMPTPTPEPSTSGGRVTIAATVDPNSITPGQPTTFTYTLYIDNVGTARVHLVQIGDLLPSSFTYVAGSALSTGISKSGGDFVLGEPATTTVDGQQQLTWDYAAPLPWVDGGTTAVVNLQATATPTSGTYPNTAWVEADPDSIGVVSTGSSSPIVAGWPEFDVAAAAGSVTIKARARLPDNGVFILSWKVE